MKVSFIDAKARFDNSRLKSLIVSRFKNKRYGLVSAVQFLPQLKEIKESLPNSIIAGQVVGCNVLNTVKLKEKVKGFVYVGSAYFYPIEIAAKTKLPVYVANPLTNKITVISRQEVEDYEKKKRGKLLKFLYSTRVGILVSTKPGQENMRLAHLIKEKLNKESFIFISNTLNPSSLEDYPDVKYWINTSCSRIENSKIINYEDIPREFLEVEHKSKSFKPNLIKTR